MISHACSRVDQDSPIFRGWSVQMKEQPGRMWRKIWEFCFISEALRERGMLVDDSRGLGFAVGKEPLAALYAAMGCEVVATDQPVSGAEASWASSNQHAASLDHLNEKGICPAAEFRERVQFRPVDMTRLPEDLTGFDFLWSSCAFEHLFSIDAGLDFVRNAMRCLKPGGVAVHTTEYNCVSNDRTLDSGGVVLYRRRDLEALRDSLRAEGHSVEMDFDLVPEEAFEYSRAVREDHLWLTFGGFTTTSYGIVVQKSPHLAEAGG